MYAIIKAHDCFDGKTHQKTVEVTNSTGAKRAATLFGDEFRSYDLTVELSNGAVYKKERGKWI